MQNMDKEWAFSLVYNSYNLLPSKVKVKEDVMGEECSMHMRDEKCIQKF
jgi:hypothetical protein